MLKKARRMAGPKERAVQFLSIACGKNEKSAFRGKAVQSIARHAGLGKSVFCPNSLRVSNHHNLISTTTYIHHNSITPTHRLAYAHFFVSM